MMEEAKEEQNLPAGNPVEEEVSGDVSVESNVQTPKGRKKLIIIGGVALLLVAISATLLLTSFGKKLIGLGESEHKTDNKKESDAQTEPKELFFVELPDVLINLRSQSGRGGFLKISLVLELSEQKDEEGMKNMKPRIIDQFQIFLRELDVEDIKGAAGMQRIRQELLTRVNAISHPIKVRNVLFKEFLMQ